MDGLEEITERINLRRDRFIHHASPQFKLVVIVHEKQIQRLTGLFRRFACEFPTHCFLTLR